MWVIVQKRERWLGSFGVEGKHICVTSPKVRHQSYCTVSEIRRNRNTSPTTCSSCPSTPFNLAKLSCAILDRSLCESSPPTEPPKWWSASKALSGDSQSRAGARLLQLFPFMFPDHTSSTPSRFHPKLSPLSYWSRHILSTSLPFILTCQHGHPLSSFPCVIWSSGPLTYLCLPPYFHYLVLYLDL